MELKKLFDFLHVTHHRGADRMSSERISKKEEFEAWVATLPVSREAQACIKKVYTKKSTEWGKKQKVNL